jgi:hypothetical protein
MSLPRLLRTVQKCFGRLFAICCSRIILKTPAACSDLLIGPSVFPSILHSLAPKPSVHLHFPTLPARDLCGLTYSLRPAKMKTDMSSQHPVTTSSLTALQEEGSDPPINPPDIHGPSNLPLCCCYKIDRPPSFHDYAARR